MKHLLKLLTCNVLFVIILVLIVNTSQASTLEGKFDGTKLTLTNGIPQGKNYVSSFWISGNNVLTAGEWIPGYYSSSVSKVMLTNNIGDSISLDIKFTGLEYNLATSPKHTLPVSSGYPTCANSGMGNSNIYQLQNSSPSFCTSPNKLVLPSNNVPFRFLRPIFQIDESTLKDKFKGKSAGKYRGTVLGLNTSYGFKVSQQNPIWTYRNLPIDFDIVIDYQGNKLTNITVSGSGMMPPIYDTTKHTVNGETKFNIKADGYFTDGLEVELISKPDYSLKHTASGESIPYSLTCKNCSTPNLVRNGILVNSKTAVLKPNSTEIIFDIDVEYQDIPKGTLVTGSYNDTFVLIMGPKV
ncbi:hypothetical protein [Vibrio chagasii]|uniref:hypothetical protein n=1 Tax=Vibrio chagasii TaxID=170679 RepID=UPI003D9FC48B